MTLEEMYWLELHGGIRRTRDFRTDEYPADITDPERIERVEGHRKRIDEHRSLDKAR
jgi:hypothetical protein